MHCRWVGGIPVSLLVTAGTVETEKLYNRVGDIHYNSILQHEKRKFFNGWSICARVGKRIRI